MIKIKISNRLRRRCNRYLLDKSNYDRPIHMHTSICIYMDTKHMHYGYRLLMHACTHVAKLMHNHGFIPPPPDFRGGGGSFKI